MVNQVQARIRSWNTLGRELLFCAAPWVSLYREKVELPTGRVVDDFYRVVLPEFAVVVPVTTGGEVVMVRGYKHGLGRITLSPPAGLMHRGEPAMSAAQRELLEETGYESAQWERLGTFVVDGNRQCGTMHLFLARDARQTNSPEQDDMEELQTELFSRARLVEALRAGEVGNLAGAGAVALALVLAL